MSKSSRLEKLWRTYSTDFERHSPAHIKEQVAGLVDPFMCPLCWRAYAYSLDLARIVAEEHILSRSLGGRLTTLTCRECNNRDGSRVESHLVQKVRIETGVRHPTGYVNMGDATFRAEMRFARSEDDYNDIIVISKQSDSRQLKKAWNSLTTDNWVGKKIELSLEYDYNPELAQVALVRSAYLFMFWRIGYPYVFNESAVVIRNQLARPAVGTPVLRGICQHNNLGMPASIMFAEATNPPDFRKSLGVFLQLDKESGTVAQVVLPPVNSDGTDFYSRLEGQNYQKELTYVVDTKSLNYLLNKYPGSC